MKARSIKCMRKILLACCCFFALQCQQVKSAEQIGEAMIPVEQVFQTQNKIPANLNRSFSYQLRALDDVNPMPKGSENGVFEFSLNDSQKTTIGPIYYWHGGVYEYEISQIIEKRELNYTYDERVYHVSVYVKNKVDGTLGCQIVVENKKGEKTDSIIFQNGYTGKVPENTNGVKTGDAKSPFMWLICAGVSMGVAGNSIMKKRK